MRCVPLMQSSIAEEDKEEEDNERVGSKSRSNLKASWEIPPFCRGRQVSSADVYSSA